MTAFRLGSYDCYVADNFPSTLVTCPHPAAPTSITNATGKSSCRSRFPWFCQFAQRFAQHQSVLIFHTSNEARASPLKSARIEIVTSQASGTGSPGRSARAASR